VQIQLEANDVDNLCFKVENVLAATLYSLTPITCILAHVVKKIARLGSVLLPQEKAKQQLELTRSANSPLCLLLLLFCSQGINLAWHLKTYTGQSQTTCWIFSLLIGVMIV
jgi:hypothetical protein